MSHKWQILYHHEVEKDLATIGRIRAKRVIKAIEEKLTTEPEKFIAAVEGKLQQSMHMHKLFSIRWRLL